MSWQVDALTVGFAAGAFVMQMGFPKRRALLFDSFNVSVMAGAIGVGLFALVVIPSPIALVDFGLFSPHAYNLILWPVAWFLVVRPKFTLREALPVFLMLYGLDELLWNSLALAYFWGDWRVLTYLAGPAWWLFFSLLLGASGLVYLRLRPRFRPNVTWVTLPAFAFVWGWVAGFPTLAIPHPELAPAPVVAQGFAWEIMWQLAYWAFAWATLAPRDGR